MIGDKSRLYVINKSDLIEKTEAEKWLRRFKAAGEKCMCANSLSKSDAPALIKNLLELNAPRIDKYRAKGIAKGVRAMVIGVPNTGKSSLINSLVKEKQTATGNRPGVTRGKQIVAIDKYISLIDSPGVLFPDFADQKKAVRLAMIGCIKDEILDIGELAAEALKFLAESYPDALAARYGLSGQDLGEIAVRRGYLLSGGEPDRDRAARAVITDLRKGSFGKISLEKAGD